MTEPFIVEREQLARTAPERWSRQYEGTRDTDKAEITRQLLAALAAPSFNASLVDAIIGNGSWTSIRCNGCDVMVSIAVVVGEPEDYESRTATLCKSCLLKAVETLGNWKE